MGFPTAPRSLRRAIIFAARIILVAIVVACANGSAAESAQDAATSPDARARTFIDLMARDRFEQAFEMFTPQMKAAMPLERLRATWIGLVTQAGPFQRLAGTSVVPRGVLSVVVVTCAFEHATFDVHVTINPARLVGGLGMRPVAEAVAYVAPAYATPETITESDITVGAGRWVLPGTLTMPAEKERVPAVVLVHGSGAGDRDAGIGPIKPFKDIALGLASRGIAVLRYDKRGRVHANLLRDLPGFTVKDESIDDAIAAVDLLRRTPGVDPDRIVVIGHSLGGMLVPRIAAAGPPIAGFVVLAGAARPIPQAVLEQARYLAQADGAISADEQAQLKEIEQLMARIEALGAADSANPERIFGAPASYWLDLRGYDPPAAATQVKQPMLVLQGERDYQVTMEEFARWRSALANRKDVSFRSYPALNHLFVAGTGKSVPAEYNTPGHVSEDVVRDIAAWITGIQPRR